MIQNAFAIADPSRDYFENFAMLQVESPETEEFQTAKENLINTAQGLLEVAIKEADASVGAYLQGVPKHPDKQKPWVSKLTHVQKALLEKPEVFRAGAAYENAERALMEAGKSDVQRRNMRRMMEIGSGLLRYAHAHDNTFPDNLALLYEKGYLKAEVEGKSLMTGKSYHYVAGGETSKPSIWTRSDESAKSLKLRSMRNYMDGLLIGKIKASSSVSGNGF